jgi:hypothetical protein
MKMCYEDFFVPVEVSMKKRIEKEEQKIKREEALKKRIKDFKEGNRPFLWKSDYRYL